MTIAMSVSGEHRTWLTAALTSESALNGREQADPAVNTTVPVLYAIGA